jgi:hypothetical protein
MPSIEEISSVDAEAESGQREAGASAREREASKSPEERDSDYVPDADSDDEDRPLLQPDAPPVAPQSDRNTSHQLIQFSNVSELIPQQQRWIQEAFETASNILQQLELQTTVRLKIDHMSNVFAGFSGLQGLELVLQLKDHCEEGLAHFMSLQPKIARHPIVETLKSMKRAQAMIVGVETHCDSTCQILKVVEAHAFWDVVRRNWHVPDFFHNPAPTCAAIPPELTLDLRILTDDYKQFVDMDEPKGHHPYDMCLRICELYIQGGASMDESQLPRSRRGDPQAVLMKSAPASTGVECKKKRSKPPTTLRGMVAEYAQRLKRQLKPTDDKAGQGKPNAIRGGAKRRKKTQRDGHGRKEAGQDKEAGPQGAAKAGSATQIVDTERLRQRIHDARCVEEMISRDVMLSILTAPAIMESLRTPDAGAPNNAREVEDAVFAHAVWARINELVRGDSLSDRQEELEALRQRLTAGLPVVDSAAAGARYWTSEYVDRHPSFHITPEFKLLCSTVHQMMSSLLDNLWTTFQQPDKPEVEADALAARAFQIITDDAPPERDATRPTAPFQPAVHVAITYVNGLQNTWRAQKHRSKDPPKEVLHAFLRLKSDPTTAVFATPLVMLAVSRAATPAVQQNLLRSYARYFLSGDCKLVRSGVLNVTNQPMTFKTWYKPGPNPLPQA